MDTIDDTNDREQRVLELKIQAIRNQEVTPQKYTGACQFCREPLESPLAFCDADCRDDFAKLERQKQHRG